MISFVCHIDLGTTQKGKEVNRVDILTTLTQSSPQMAIPNKTTTATKTAVIIEMREIWSSPSKGSIMFLSPVTTVIQYKLVCFVFCIYFLSHFNVPICRWRCWEYWRRTFWWTWPNLSHLYHHSSFGGCSGFIGYSHHCGLDCVSVVRISNYWLPFLFVSF